MNGVRILYPVEYFILRRDETGDRIFSGNVEIIKNDAWIGRISYIPISFSFKNEARIATNNATELIPIPAYVTTEVKEGFSLIVNFALSPFNLISSKIGSDETLNPINEKFTW